MTNTYPAASLETAACLWEAVLEMEAAPDRSATDDPAAIERAAAIRATREAIGSSGLRLTVIGWTGAVDAAWKAADVIDGRSGQYGDTFDWDFVPGWIVANVDWSDPHYPHVKPSRTDYALRRADIARRHGLTPWEAVCVDMLALLGSGPHARPIEGSDYFGHDAIKLGPIVRAEIAAREGASK